VVTIYGINIPSPFVGNINSLNASLEFYRFDKNECKLTKTLYANYYFTSPCNNNILLSKNGEFQFVSNNKIIFEINVMTIEQKGFEVLHQLINMVKSESK
jgi:hypothetical protein